MQNQHITFTGYYAGTPVCRVHKPNAQKAGDTFGHLGDWVDNPHIQNSICPDCKAIYLDMRKDGDLMPSTQS